MQGMYVITPTQDVAQLRVGKIVSDYYFEENPADSRFSHRRKVNWFDKLLPRNALPVTVQNSLRSAMTIFQLNRPEEVLEFCGVKLLKSSKQIDITEDRIAKLILQNILDLSADEFEILVEALLGAIGFDAKKVGKSGDNGIDVEGTLSLYEFASVELKVQVKRYARDRISHNAIKDLRGSLPDQSQGAFVTTSDYTAKARDEASKEGFKKIGLINGEQLVDILIEHYDDLPSEIKDKLNLRRMLIPTRLANN